MQVLLRQAERGVRAAAGNNVGAVLRVERLDDLAVHVAQLCHLVDVQVARHEHRVRGNGVRSLVGADVVLAIIVHDVVRRDKCRHIAARLLRQVGINRPIVLRAIGSVDSFRHIARAAVVGGDDKAPIVENLIEVSQIFRGGVRSLVGVATLVDKAVHRQSVTLGGGQHELPQAHSTGAGDRRGVERRLYDGQIFQFERQAVEVEGFLEDGYIHIARAEHHRHRIAQAAAVAVDELLHNIIIGHLHHHGQAAQAFLIHLGRILGVDVRVFARRVGIEIFLHLPLAEQRVGIDRHAFGQVDHLVRARAAVVYGDSLLRLLRVGGIQT